MNKLTKRATYLTTATLLASTLSNVTIPVLASELIPNATAPSAASTLTSPSGLIFNFESDLEGWGNRGDAQVTLSSDAPHTGTNCLKITNRKQDWQGVQKDITNIVKKNNTYTIGAWVKYTNGVDTEQLTLSLQLDTSDGAPTQYNWICNNDSVKKGEWTYLSGDITLPNNTKQAILYIEASNADLDFYVDDASISGDFSPAEEEIPPTDIQIQQDIPSLKEVYEDYFKFGAAVAPHNLNDLEKELVAKHFNSITCENAMKPEAMLDYDATIKYMEENGGDETHPQVHLSPEARETLDFARDYNIPVRGHVLVWHSQTPNWLFTEGYSKDKDAKFVSKEIMLQRLENYIDAVFEILDKEYPDVDFYAFDVVNEAVNPSSPDGLRFPATSATTSGDDGNNENANNSMWMTTIGAEHIEKAFEYARAASSKYPAFNNVKLAYNDYNECDPVKADIIYNICKNLYDKGLIDVIGLQSHHNMNTPSISQFEDAVRKYASIGENIELQVTELDIMQPDSSEEGMVKQAYRYKGFLDAMKRLDAEGAKITSCTVWGVRDSESWRSEQSPLLFDKNYQAKPAFWGITDSSKLPVPTQELTSYSVNSSDLTEAFCIQNDTTLETADGTKLGTFKVIWDKDQLYVKVTPVDALKGKNCTVKVFCNSQTPVTASANDIIKVPVSTGLNSDCAIRFDVSIMCDDQIATWNNANYDGTSTPNLDNLGKLHLKSAPKMASAIKGTPTIDGKIDSIWSQATPIDINTFSVGSNGATGTARMLWDEDYIYILTEVKDALLSKESTNDYEQDSVEIFIDEDNAKSPSYEKGDGQYRVNFENKRSINGFTDADSFKSATALTDSGYIVEVALPSRLAKFKDNQLIGFDVQINDDANGNGTRDNVSNWNDLTGNGWSSTADYGILKLTAPSTSSDSGSSSSSPSSSGGGGGSTPTVTKTPSEIIKEAINKNETPNVSLDTTHKLTLAKDTLALLTEKATSVNIQSNLVALTLTPDFIKTNLDNKSALDLSVSPVTKDHFTKIESQVKKQEGLSMLDNESQVVTVDLKADKNLTEFKEPLKLTFDLSKANLEDSSNLTLAQYKLNDDNTLILTKLGGEYDPKTQSFNALIDQPGTYGIVKADELTKISLQLGTSTGSLNSKSIKLDIAPEVVDSRTLVPLRFVCESLDLKVDWNSKLKEITLTSSDNQTLSLRINKNIKDYGAPIIKDKRTLVPLRYISEELGAHVLWIPSSKTIEIVK